MSKAMALSIIIFTGILFSAFIQLQDKPQPIPPSKQRTGGNVQKGYEYLTTGNYVSSGIPYNLFFLSGGTTNANFLNRQGLNKKLPHSYTAITADNNEVLVAPNCLQCHAQVFENKLVIGLGNTTIDFANDKVINREKIERGSKMIKTFFPKKYEASESFFTVTKTMAPYLITETRGVNAAGRLAYVLIAHRNPNNLQWLDEPILEIPNEVVPTDTPPWWLLKKKNAMFYNGFGRGDFGRFLMASNLLTVKDSAESGKVDAHMPDVLAYINSLEPPKYPKPINTALAAEGKVLFEKSCAKCHGKYGAEETYPNLLIPQSIIKTDSLLFKSNYSNPQFIEWFNKSWFTQGDHPARLEPYEGYIAPPLDGIWVTAPYLHNGSVPNLEGLLNSKLRPQYWKRNFKKLQYDYEKVGWQYTQPAKPADKETYNTDLPGYGNYGHYFGDKFTEAERNAVIEYLKTL